MRYAAPKKCFGNYLHQVGSLKTSRSNNVIKKLNLSLKAFNSGTMFKFEVGELTWARVCMQRQRMEICEAIRLT